MHQSRASPSWNGEMLSTPEAMCHIFSQQYTKVFLQPDPREFFGGHNKHLYHHFDITFPIPDIQWAISKLETKSAAGLDGVPFILLLSAEVLASHLLYKMWCCFLDTAIILAMLKEAVCSPLHKGGDRSQAKNYKSVALISHLMKIFEKIIRDGIITWSLCLTELGINGSFFFFFLSSFANDITLSHRIMEEKYVVHLQENIHKIFAWAESNNMKLNEPKKWTVK